MSDTKVKLMEQTYNAPPLVVQIVGMILFGRFVQATDHKGLGEVLEAASCTGNEAVLFMVNEWDQLPSWLGFNESAKKDKVNEIVKACDIQVSDERSEESLVCAAAGAFMLAHGGITGIAMTRDKFIAFRKRRGLELAGVKKRLSHAVTDLGSDENGNPTMKAHAFGGEDAEQVIGALESNGVKFYSIGSLEELESLDIPEEAKAYARATIQSGNCEMPLRLGIGRRPPSDADDVELPEPVKARKLS